MSTCTYLNQYKPLPFIISHVIRTIIVTFTMRFAIEVYSRILELNLYYGFHQGAYIYKRPGFHRTVERFKIFASLPCLYGSQAGPLRETR